MTPKLSFLASTAFVCSLIVGCGTDERIQGVDNSGLRDSGTGSQDDDVSSPFGSDDDADDDTASVPTTRPSTTPTPSSTPAVLTSDLGLPCNANSDCGDGLECMKDTSDAFFGGGPAHGMCTLSCASDFDCLAVDSNGFCLPLSDTDAVCVPSCVAGDSLLGETKCVGRLDMACASVDATSQTFNFCVPMCGTDDDCPDGRYCDIGFGTCVDDPLSGDGVGTECDPNADQNDCATGLCLGFSDTFGVCSGLCRTGTVGCGSGDLMPADPGEPVCLPLFSGIALDGDIGQCVQRCNCDLDCDHPDAKCFAVFGTDADGMAAIGAAGVCIDGAAADDPNNADLRIGIECTDGRESPMMSEAGVPDDAGSGGASSEPKDSGPMMTPIDSGNQPEPTAQPEPAVDAATPDGG